MSSPRRYRVRAVHTPPTEFNHPVLGPLSVWERSLSYHRTIELATKRANLHRSKPHLRFVEVAWREAVAVEGDPPTWFVFGDDDEEEEAR